tara:strand:- start:6762 stop:7007 length:246 start_codon:yes stop_codon:yes gene_type:complete
MSDKKNILKELNIIFKDVFNNKNLNINDNSSAKNIKNWDSFIQMNLIISIEAKYNISFSSAELEKLQNVGQMIDLINNKIK